jgi:fructuronate reductase
MGRLGAASLAGLARTVRRPGYDRMRLVVGMAHLGVGAFHRCHQSEYTDDSLEAEFGPWGEIGINIRAPLLAPTLGAQDGLYTRTLRDEGVAESRVIGCLRETLDALDDTAPAIAALAAPRISIVTMTVTEKGYCHFPATGRLDFDHPDIAVDLQGKGSPRSVPGVLVAALDRRRQSGAGGLTLMSCDNIPGNGGILSSAVTALAERRSPALAEWIAGNVRFPSSMVDRIVPATTEADLAAAAALGLEDRAAVVGEPFRQWVIEDRFLGARPRWDLAGAELVGDVEPYEQVKMRVLNGAQTTMSYLGALVGLDYTFEDVRDPGIAAFVRRMLIEETAPGLPTGAMDIPDYIELTFRRLLNKSIRHRNHQIATDGSQKIVQRLLNPIRACIARSIGFDHLAAAVAAWMAYLLAASPRFGARWTPSDPWAERVRRIGDEIGGDASALVRAVLAIEPIFGADLPANDILVRAVTRHLQGWLLGDPRRHLGDIVAATVS